MASPDQSKRASKRSNVDKNFVDESAADELSEYEAIRLRNIETRERLLQELKIVDSITGLKTSLNDSKV
jgi:hypothetical protein